MRIGIMMYITITRCIAIGEAVVNGRLCVMSGSRKSVKDTVGRYKRRMMVRMMVWVMSVNMVRC